MIRALLLSLLLIPQAIQPVGGITTTHAAAGGVSFVKQSTLQNTSNTTDISVSFGTLPAAGNTVVFTATAYNGAWTACDDNQGNGAYTKARDALITGIFTAEIWYKTNIGSPSGTFTVTCTGGLSGKYGNALLVELSNVNNSTPIRDSGEATGVVTATNANVATDGTAAVIGDLVIAATVVDEDTNVHLGANANTGYTNLAIDQDSSTIVSFSGDYKAVTSDGSQTAAWTHDDTSSATQGWACIIVVFQKAS